MYLDKWREPILAAVAILSVGLNVFQYRRRGRRDRLEAQRQLDKLEIETERLQARHRQEVRELEASYEGEIRERARTLVDFRTAKDKDRLSALYQEQGRQLHELFTDMTYYQNLLGNGTEAFFVKEKFFPKINRKIITALGSIVSK